jgi:hypothetical protein
LLGRRLPQRQPRDAAYDSSEMLRIVEDDAPSRRLVLQAPPLRTRDRLRRAVATTLAAASAASAALPLALLSSPYHLLWSTPLGLVAAWWLMGIHAFETLEVGVDGRTRAIWVRRRERFWWIVRHVDVALDDPSVSLRVVSGLVPREGPHRPEIGLALSMGRLGETFDLLAPTFTVERVDRRDEALALIDLLTTRLGLRRRTESETLARQSTLIAHSGDEPASEALRFGGYRQGAVDPEARWDRSPSFEEPARGTPPLSPSGSTELRETVRREGDAWVVEAPRVSAVKWSALGAAGLLSAALVLVHLYGGFRLPLYVAIPLGLLAGAIGAVGGGAAIGVMVTLGGLAVLAFLERALGGFEGLPLTTVDTPRRVRIAKDGLELEGLFGRRAIRRNTAWVVLVRPASRSTGGGRYTPARSYYWNELWLHDSRRWRRLARTRESSQMGTATPDLDALAVEVARALDVPLREG